MQFWAVDMQIFAPSFYILTQIAVTEVWWFYRSSMVQYKICSHIPRDNT